MVKFKLINNDCSFVPRNDFAKTINHVNISRSNEPLDDQHLEKFISLSNPWFEEYEVIPNDEGGMKNLTSVPPIYYEPNKANTNKDTCARLNVQWLALATINERVQKARASTKTSVE